MATNPLQPMRTPPILYPLATAATEKLSERARHPTLQRAVCVCVLCCASLSPFFFFPPPDAIGLPQQISRCATFFSDSCLKCIGTKIWLGVNEGHRLILWGRLIFKPCK